VNQLEKDIYDMINATFFYGYTLTNSVFSESFYRITELARLGQVVNSLPPSSLLEHREGTSEDKTWCVFDTDSEEIFGPKPYFGSTPMEAINKALKEWE
jgi:hypothetical protein